MCSEHETVLIGVCDGAIGQRKNTTYFTNKIGDIPDRLPTISFQYPRCNLCNQCLTHIVQVYCPLEASPYHRSINVFACVNPQCYGKPESWRVLRSQCLETEVRPSQGETSRQVKDTGMLSTDWCEGADDWGMEDESGAQAENLTQTETQAPELPSDGLEVSISLQNLCIQGEEPQDIGATFQALYMSVIEETNLVGPNDIEHAKTLQQEYERREGAVVRDLGGCEGGGEEKYEKAKARHGDAVFSNFMKKICWCPEQVLRYSWGGSPLFISQPPSNIKQMVLPCIQCGSQRIFEFQLMPALVSLLHGEDSNTELAVEFGTILVYTCKNSCWISGSSSPIEEFLFVQADPDQNLFK